MARCSGSEITTSIASICGASTVSSFAISELVATAEAPPGMSCTDLSAVSTARPSAIVSAGAFSMNRGMLAKTVSSSIINSMYWSGVYGGRPQRVASSRSFTKCCTDMPKCSAISVSGTARRSCTSQGSITRSPLTRSSAERGPRALFGLFMSEVSSMIYPLQPVNDLATDCRRL